MKWHTHQELEREILSIAGHYKILEEGKIAYGNREFLYIMGGAAVESACCGSGGCQFVHVPGYIISWKTQTTAEGLFMSEVEPVAPLRERQGIRRLLAAKFPHAQITVSFDE